MKTIKGTWFEFRHHNKPEGKYWNPICRRFTDEQWRAKVREMYHMGMEYVVLMCSSLVYENEAEAYFETDIFPFPEDMVCKDPIGVLLDECDKCDMKVFVSCGFYGVWTHTYENMTSPEVTARAFKAMDELWAQYGSHKSFYGWYFPDETCIKGHFLEEFITYVNAYSAHAHKIAPHTKTLIAPYGTNILVADEEYVEQLKQLDVDIIAYQDEIGVRKSTPDQTGAYYKALRAAHDAAGRSADFLYGRQKAAAHRAQYASSQLVSGQICQQFPVSGIYRQVAELLDQFPGLAGNVLSFCQQRNRLISGSQRPLNDFGAFGDKTAFGCVLSAAQLAFGQAGIDV